MHPCPTLSQASPLNLSRSSRTVTATTARSQVSLRYVRRLPLTSCGRGCGAGGAAVVKCPCGSFKTVESTFGTVGVVVLHWRVASSRTPLSFCSALGHRQVEDVTRVPPKFLACSFARSASLNRLRACAKAFYPTASYGSPQSGLAGFGGNQARRS